MRIYDVFQQIKEAKGIKQRKAILEQNMNETIRYIFNDTYGSKKYGISVFILSGDVGELTLDNDYIVFHNVLNQLHRKEVEGQEAYNLLQNTVAQYDKESQEILCNIIARNLKIGLSYDSFLNVIGINDATFKIPTFSDINSKEDIKTDGTYYIMNRVPGVRCICKTVKYNGEFNAAFYLENGDLITTLDNLEADIETLTGYLGCNQFVLDGIIQIDGELDQTTIENAISGDTQIENPKYVLFDVMTKSQFEMREESPNLDYRLGNLRNIIGFANLGNISLIEYTKVDSEDVLSDWLSHSVDCKCEGCMIRKNTIYKNNTKNDCLMYKHTIQSN